MTQLYQTTAFSDYVNYSSTNSITSGGGDYAMISYYPSASVSIFKRGSDGYYNLLLTVGEASNFNSTSTNGNWFSYVLSTGSGRIFQLNGTTIINSVTIASAGAFTNVLSDDSVVFLGSSAVKTYQNINGTWSLIDTSSATLPAASMYPQYHMTDTTLAIYESGNSRVKLYTRANNSSWIVQDQFAFTNQVSRIIWTGDNTVLLTYYIGTVDPRGIAYVYVKIGGTWTNPNTTTAADLGITMAGSFGQHVALIDNDNIAISANVDHQSVSRAFDSGTVFLLTRTSATSWSYSRKFQSRIGGNVFGSSLTLNARDLLIGQCSVQVPLDLSSFTLDCSFNPLPRCFYQPINVTCNDVTFDSCSTAPDLSAVELFTVNNPLCGTTTSSLDRVQFSGTSLHVDLTFERTFVPPVTCNISLTCPVLSPDVVSIAPQNGPSNRISSAGNYSMLINVFLFLLIVLLI